MPHSGSLLRQLQLSFALATLAIVGLLAVFMDVALHRSLESEDAVVLVAQADAISRRIAENRSFPGDRERGPEKAAWRLVDETGHALAQSVGMDSLPPLPWPAPGRFPIEISSPGGDTYSILVRSLPQGTLQLAMDRSHEQALVTGFRRTLAVAIGIAALLAALLGRWVARRGLRPLGQLVREAGDIDPRRLDRRLHGEHFPEELGELVGTLNQALARLQEAFDRLGRMASELAHELRTPLQNLRAEVEAILLGPRNDDASREALGSVLEECERLARLIEQMLFLARSDNPANAIDRKPVNALSLLRSVAEFFEAEAEESQVMLRVDAPGTLETPGTMEIPGDEPLLQRALHNLTANALRHTPPGGSVVLGTKIEGSYIGLVVRDSGEGLPLEVLSRLGERWVRGSHPRGPGLGLGLAIVKGIAQLHGGALKVENLPGGGAEAALWLPLASITKGLNPGK